MSKAFLYVSAAALALAACAPDQAGDANSRQESAAPADETAPAGQMSAREGAAELGEWGVDLAAMNGDVDPGDDFFRYVNGTWLDTFEIPPDRSSYGAFVSLLERSERRIQEIVDAERARNPAPGTNAQKIVDLYDSYMDAAAIETRGLEPAQPMLDAIDAAQDRDDLAALFGDVHLTAPFGAGVTIDAKDPDSYVVAISHGGLGLPDRDYYVNEENERFAQVRERYTAYIEEVLRFAGDAAAGDAAQAIMALETRLAEQHWERARRRDRDQNYNPMTLAELEAHAPGLPWTVMLEEAGIGGQPKYIIREADAFPAIAEIFAETPVETWKSYLRFHFLRTHAQYLPSALDEANFDMYGRTLSGQPEQRTRDKRAVQLVSGGFNSGLGEAVGEIYVERYFPPESKAAMEELVANLRRAFARRIEGLDWMSEETKARAREKLDKFTPKIGYREQWKDYSSLEIDRDDLFGNILRQNEYDWNWSIARLGRPVDKSEWGMTPQVVNAYYNPQRNEIVFPAAILQPPFFDPNADPAVNYGGIGGVIGHEMGHGFDDQGRKSDGDGVQRDWWTPEDAERFNDKADRLGAQYAQYEPIEGMFINPRLTMGENIGDLGGLSIAYEAYRLSLNGEEAPVIDGFTGDQRFFMGWAQVWRTKYRDDALRRRLVSDSHSPAEFRTNGVVRNMDAWYAAFNVDEGDALYLPPADRVSIW
ncbi:MAG: M13 family metallopeptidase [Parvularculaceae bacterium]